MDSEPQYPTELLIEATINADKLMLRWVTAMRDLLRSGPLTAEMRCDAVDSADGVIESLQHSIARREELVS